ncbi:hypothetical protein V2A60_005770 [Cordyceps javanica]
MALTTNRPVLPILSPVATIGDISVRLAPVLSSVAEPRRSAIAWAGVFGSFARGDQTDASDVDLLVGLVPRAAEDDVYYARGDVLAQLDEAMGRTVDCFFLRHGQPLPFVLCRALLHAKTVHGSDAWLAENGARAEALFVATVAKVRTLLAMMQRLLDMLGSKADENNATACPESGTLRPQLADGLCELVHYMYTRSDDQEAMDAYFHGVYDRLLPIKRIWEEYSYRVPLRMNTGEGREIDHPTPLRTPGFRIWPDAGAGTRAAPDSAVMLLRIGGAEVDIVASNGDDALVKALLAADSIDVNATGSGGRTALSLAVSGMHVAVVRLLLAHDKVDKDKRDLLGQTPLLVAVMLRAPSEEARGKRRTIIDALLDTGMCSIYAADTNGNTPLNRAKAGRDRKLASDMMKKPGPKRFARLRDKE